MSRNYDKTKEALESGEYDTQKLVLGFLGILSAIPDLGVVLYGEAEELASVPTEPGTQTEEFCGNVNYAIDFTKSLSAEYDIPAEAGDKDDQGNEGYVLGK